MNLSEFLLARIAEDERLAHGRIDAPDWQGVDAWGEETSDYIFTQRGPCDPARVLADAEAKRAVVDTWRWVDAHVRAIALSNPAEARDARNTRTGLQVAMQALALPYADHPDYDEEWKP